MAPNLPGIGEDIFGGLKGITGAASFLTGHTPGLLMGAGLAAEAGYRGASRSWAAGNCLGSWAAGNSRGWRDSRNGWVSARRRLLRRPARQLALLTSGLPCLLSSLLSCWRRHRAGRAPGFRSRRADRDSRGSLRIHDEPAFRDNANFADAADRRTAGRDQPVFRRRKPRSDH